MGALKVWDGTQWLMVGQGAPPVPRVRRTKSADQTGLVNNTYELITFGLETENTDASVFSYTGGPTHGVIVMKSGVYSLSVAVPFSADPNGRRAVLITLNDAGIAPTSATDASIIGGDTRMAVPVGATKVSLALPNLRLAESDILRVYGLHQAGSGVTLDIQMVNFGPVELVMTRVGD